MGTYANFYNSDNIDRVYNADSFSEWLRPFFKNGVFNGELQVVADTGMNVKVRTGNAYIDGKMKNFENETTLTLEKASANSKRIDSVVVRRNDTERDFSILVVKGSTSAPDPVRQEGIYDLVLAHITVEASATEIKQANITDTRMNADLCGWVVTNIDEIDFSQITSQWSDYIANFEAEQLQAFQTWFDTIKGQLGSDVAGSLQTQINNINTDVSGLQTDVSALQTKSFEGTSGTVETKGGYLHDMMIFGKSIQDGTPTPNNPIEIKSVVNPKVTVRGKNLLKPTLETTTLNGVTCTNNGNGTYTLNGTATSDADFILCNYSLKANTTYKLVGCPKGGSDSTYYLNPRGYEHDIGNGKVITRDLSTDWNNSMNIVIKSGVKVNNLLFKPMLTYDLNATYNDFEPYKEQSATLPYTLNAIPVSSGGNVTINGQQYIADYVDIERKKLVRKLQYRNISSLDKSKWEFRTDINSVNATKYKGFGGSFVTDCNAISNIMPRDTREVVNTFRMVNATYYLFQFNLDKTQFPTVEDWTNYLTNNDVYIIYELETPTEIDLTDEEVSQFKALKTYEPTTNIIASSDVLNPLVKCDYSLNKETNNIYDRLQENASDVSNITTRLNGLTFVALTQTEYDALSTKDDNTIYFITEG